METFIERLLVGLAGSGLQIVLVSTRRPPAGWLSQHGITWRFGPRDFRPRDVALTAKRAGLAASISTAARQLRPHRTKPAPSARSLTDRGDVLYAPWVSTLIDADDLLRAGLPVVTSCRGALVSVAPWDPSRPGYRAQLRAAFDAATAVHCVSDRIVLDAVELGLDPTKAQVIRPAVDPDQFVPRRVERDRTGPTRVVAVGGLTWRKDFEHALMGMRGALDLGADLELRIIGGGPDEQHLRFAIDDLGLTDRVTLVGQRSADEVRTELQASDIFLHTSSSEGISNAVLEAMATALPVITTDAGGMREAVRDQVDGVVVGVRDRHATAAALARLAADPDLRIRMGDRARERVAESFRLSDQVERFRELLMTAAGR